MRTGRFWNSTLKSIRMLYSDWSSNKDKYEAVNVSASLMGVSFDGVIYTNSSSSAITSVPTYAGYTPEAQAVMKPTFKHNLTLTNGEVRYSIDIPKGETATLDASGYTVSKYAGQSITVNITCSNTGNGATVEGKKITFSKVGTYTITYTVTDNTSYKADGSRNEISVNDTYTVTVVVSNSNHPNAVINLDNLTKTTKWVESGSAFDKDYSAYFEVLGGLVITDYNEDGTPFVVTISASNLNGLTIKANADEVTGISVDGEQYWMYDTKADDNKSDKSVTFIYTYKGKNGNTVTKTSAAFTLASGASSGDSGSGDSGGCVTPDTLVTLADGSKVRVDSLTGSELLLVWNMETGKLDFAPIMFVDSEKAEETDVIRLIFSDGTDVKVVYEHGFWDYDLNKYVYLDTTAADYIGHWFAKQNGDELEKVQLVDVVIETEMTEAWSPVTQGHLCYFVNGMLSMPGGVGGLFNIFDVDAETMTYDYEALARDIETYGLFTYEEMNAIVPLSEDMFNMAGGAYLKISIGKGNMTMDDLVYMIQRYSGYFN